MKFIAPQSRFLLKTFLKRNYDVLTEQAQKATDWIVLGIDIAVVVGVLAAL